MSQRRRAEGPATTTESPFTPVEGDELDFERREAELRKEFEPVAPWDRKDIPDYGPLDDRHYVLIFTVVGILATVFYETTNYFGLVNRYLAYAAIWFPLWFRLLTRVSPAPTEEEVEEREKRAFYSELQQIAKEADEVDD